MFKMFSTMTFFGLLTISAVSAQSNQPIQAAIPFPFSAQNTTLAAGNYQLTYSSSAHILSIRGLDHDSGGAFATALPTPAAGDPGKLVFHCYAKNCYLAQVSLGTDGGGLQVLATGQERRVALFTRVAFITIPSH